jgi:uncharacterized protein YebE (UPF0316 family)
MEELLTNPWLSAIIVFITQIVFLCFRTLNVQYTAEHKIWPAIFTGNMVGISWLISVSIGVKSIMALEILPIIAFLVGGSIGTYLGFKFKR